MTGHDERPKWRIKPGPTSGWIATTPAGHTIAHAFPTLHQAGTFAHRWGDRLDALRVPDPLAVAIITGEPPTP